MVFTVGYMRCFFTNLIPVPHIQLILGLFSLSLLVQKSIRLKMKMFLRMKKCQNPLRRRWKMKRVVGQR